MQQQKLKIKLPPCAYDQINKQYNYQGGGKMIEELIKIKPTVKNGQKSFSLSMENY